MGLDITAYSKLKHIGRHAKDPALNEGEAGGVDDWCYYQSHVSAFAYDTFPQSFRGLPIVGERSGNGGFRFLDAGCFEATNGTETHAFGAGSYGGYNRWRAELQAHFNPGTDPAGPFYELIWFADNEGCIGPEAAADLLVDFVEHAEAASRVWPPGFFGGPYAEFRRACELAASDGLISFH